MDLKRRLLSVKDARRKMTAFPRVSGLARLLNVSE
jgi:hypothetical protein